MKINIIIDNYYNKLEKVDFQPFLNSQVKLNDKVFLQNIDFLQNKVNFVNYGILSFLLYKNLLSKNIIIKESQYLTDNFDLYNKYFFKSFLKYNWDYRFNTYFYYWIRKIKLEYYKQYEKYVTNEIFNNFDFL